MEIIKSKRGGARPNTGGKRPGAGRKSKAEEFGLSSLISARLSKQKQGKIIDNLYRFATGDNPKAAVGAASLLLAYIYGKPTEKHEHSGDGGGAIEVVVRHVSAPTAD